MNMFANFVKMPDFNPAPRIKNPQTVTDHIMNLNHYTSLLHRYEDELRLIYRSRPTSTRDMRIQQYNDAIAFMKQLISRAQANLNSLIIKEEEI